MGYLTIINKYLADLNILSTAIRMILSIVCGGVIGIERAKSNQSAGLRTYILVCLGATIVMLTSQYMYGYFNTGDPARLGAQVICGIGFLGAGNIIIEGHSRVKGLTTAAGLWVAACIGLAIGIGFYAGGIIATILAYIVISKFKEMSHNLSHSFDLMRLYLELSSINDIETISSILDNNGLKVDNIILNSPKNTGIYSVILSIKNMEEKSNDEVIDFLKAIDGVLSVKYIN